MRVCLIESHLKRVSSRGSHLNRCINDVRCETIILGQSFQIKMKTIHFKDLCKCIDGDTWLYEEFSANILLVLISSVFYSNKRCQKVIKIHKIIHYLY